jgi:hypothetical protein
VGIDVAVKGRRAQLVLVGGIAIAAALLGVRSLRAKATPCSSDVLAAPEGAAPADWREAAPRADGDLTPFGIEASASGVTPGSTTLDDLRIVVRDTCHPRTIRLPRLDRLPGPPGYGVLRQLRIRAFHRNTLYVVSYAYGAPATPETWLLTLRRIPADGYSLRSDEARLHASVMAGSVLLCAAAWVVAYQRHRSATRNFARWIVAAMVFALIVMGLSLW